MKRIINYLIISFILIIFILRIININIYNIIFNITSNISIIIVLLSSIYLTIKLKFINFNLIKIINNITTSKKEDIKALFISLGAKIGVGSIAGTSLSIFIAGPGVLLWILIISLLSSILTYCETYLGSIYNNKGVFNYINKGLNNKTLSVIYTILLIFIYQIGFISIQTNTIYKSLKELNVINNNLLIILILIVITLLIFNNLNNIINNISKIVPIMCIIYITSLIPILLKINNIKNIIYLIIDDGLHNNKLLKIIVLGMNKGIFATESGIGTSSITTSISNSNPKKQALFQVLGTHFISLIVITLTGLIVINNRNNYIGKINGIEILMNIFNNYYGLTGKIILSIIIFLFAISTILSSYFYTLKGINYLNNSNKEDNNKLKIILLFFALTGMLINSSIIWNIIDILILFLLLINIYTILKLNKQIK